MQHSLALKSDGTVWAWGTGTALGQGISGYSGYVATTPVQVVGLAGIIEIAAGSLHSMAVRADRTVWGWGKNDYGQLGDGSYSDSSVPVQSSLPPAGLVSAGGHHTLSLEAAPTAMSVTSATAQIGKVAKFLATLTVAADGTPLSRTIDLLVDGNLAGRVIANSLGQSPFLYTVPESVGVGTHTVKAIFRGDATYLASSATGTLTVTKGPVTISVTRVSGSAGANVTLKAHMQNAAKVALVGKTLSFSVGGAFVGTAVTDSKGNCSLAYTIPVGTVAGVYQILVTFSGDANHLSGSKTATLTVL